MLSISLKPKYDNNEEINIKINQIIFKNIIDFIKDNIFKLNLF